MFKNTAGQKVALFAFDYSTGAPKTGDAANITAYVSKDNGAVNALADSSASEMDSTNAKGWYLFDLSQTETDADALLFTGKSSTANVTIVGQVVYPVSPYLSSVADMLQAMIEAGAGSPTYYRFNSAALEQTINAAGVRSAVGLASANLDTQLGAVATASALATVATYVDTEVAAIKAKTDQLTFTKTGEVDANVQSVNDVTVNGTGAVGDEWGP